MYTELNLLLSCTCIISTCILLLLLILWQLLLLLRRLLRILPPGDIKYNVNTFANKFGVRNVANFATCSLTAAYIGSILLGAFQQQNFHPIPMVGGHFGLLLYFLYSYNVLLKANNLSSSSSSSNSGSSSSNSKNDLSLSSVKVFYKSIWNLFYMEYCLYPFI
jgi:hypothetical protein